ncbi:MAG TPA: head GIN domain-containing protein [Salinimicrobium sp.]|nr:head GIN domain-containing protein [Salinimicrobium sp.]
MKNNLISTSKIVFLCFIFISASVSAQEIKKELPDFNEVKVFHGVEVVLIPSSRNSIEITGESREKVEFEVDDYRLEIRLSLENIWSNDDTQVKIFVEDLKIIDANESSIVEVSEELKGNSFIFRAQEGAAIYAKVDAEKVTSKAVTGGLIQLRGTSTRQDIEINTGGKFFGKNLETENTNVSISAGGEAEISASQYCNASAKLGGKIRIYGNPIKLDKKTSLGGKILKMN